MKAMAMMGMMVAPATMLKMTGNINLEFDDIDEVADHPYA